jgi:hypothetical protein
MKTVRHLLLFLILLCFSAGPAYAGWDIKVTSPNGGENWTFGSTYNITWTIAVPGSVKIELLQGGVVVGTIATVAQNQKTYAWEAGKYVGGIAQAGTNYKIKITATNLADSDTSDANFTIGNKVNLGFQLSSQYLTNLITIINNYLNGATTPTINGIDGIVSPGAALNIKGQGFGNSQGTIKMFGEFQGGYVVLKSSAMSNWWNDNIIYTSIPIITGVKEQTVTIQVETADHKVSNEWPATFKPLLDFTYLPATALKNIVCDQQSDENSCPTGGISFSFYCVHRNCWSTNISGIDNWSTQLKNGWVIDGKIYDFQAHGTGSANTYNSKFTPGSTDLYLEVDFNTSCSWDDCTHLEVWGNIGIVGPKDVSCQ